MAPPGDESCRRGKRIVDDGDAERLIVQRPGQLRGIELQDLYFFRIADDIIYRGQQPDAVLQL